MDERVSLPSTPTTASPAQGIPPSAPVSTRVPGIVPGIPSSTGAPVPPGLSPSGTSRPTSSVLGSICGNVEEDTNNDNVGDVNLSGVRIRLLDERNQLIAERLTDSEGKYCFTDLPEGIYTVSETNLPLIPFDVSDVEGNPLDNLIRIDLSPGQNSTGNDFVDEGCKKINGTVLEDLDNNVSGDAPINAVKVKLVVLNGTTVDTFTTGSDGKFSFECVESRRYNVVQVTPNGFIDVTDSDAGDLNLISVDVRSEDRLNLQFVDRKVCSNVAVIDFDSVGDETRLNGGEYVTSEWFQSFGFNVSASTTSGGYTPGGAARIFDTANPGTNLQIGNPLLGSPNR